ncbi:MAG: FAD-dependent oxidoreductase [Caulobacterales bacterium]
MALKRVFEPIQIGSVEIPNRIVRTAHGTHFSTTELTDQFIAYHEARAKGGCGLTILEIASVHRSSVLTVRNLDDSIIPGYRRLMKAIRPHGMKVFQQLHHAGAHAGGLDGVAWSSCDLPSPMGGVPVAMNYEQIQEVIAAFVAAAVRCKEGGLDGVEIHGAHGYLFQQFLAAGLNTREDNYGGSLDNRIRLLLETIRAVRKAVGQDFAVGVRMSASEAPSGVTREEAIAALAALQGEKLIDFADVSMGDYYRMATMNATMEAPTGYELPSAGPIAASVSVPKIVAGRFRTLEEAEEVLRSGAADLVSMVRAQIADPDLVRKTKAGHPEQVRPCIACNQGCIGGVMRGGQLGCLVNPAVGFEARLSEDLIAKTDKSKKVLIIGGGPAGMEAARVAALSGHKVILAEAQAHLGGSAYVARHAPYLQTLGDILQWLEQEVYRLGVDVRLGAYMEAEDVLAEKADVVIVATGAQPRMDGVQTMTPWAPPGGAHLPHVMSTTELLMEPKQSWGRTALVLDDVGQYEAIAAIDALMSKGLAVTYVTRFSLMTPQAEFTQRTTPAWERFVKGNFQMHVRSQLTDIRQGSCTIRSIHGGADIEIPADHVVLITPNRAMRDLYNALTGKVDSLRIAGDAQTPRDVQAAIAEGRAAAFSLMAH